MPQQYFDDDTIVRILLTPLSISLYKDKKILVSSKE